MQNTTSRDIQKKFQGAQTNLFTTALTKTPLMNTNSALKNFSGFNRVQKPSAFVSSKAAMSKGAVMPNSGISRSYQTRVMAAPVMSAQTKTTSSVKTQTPTIDAASVKQAFSTKVAAASIHSMQKPSAKIPLHVENSSLAKGMWCHEDKNGAVVCEYEECDIEVNQDQCKSEFEVQDILDRGYYEMIGEDYWGKEWDETYIYKFDEESNKKDDFVPFADVIVMALEDFDNMVYLSKMGRQGARISDISLIAPEFKNVLPPQLMIQDYDTFNLELFYEFCKTNPLDGSAQDYMYPFINLTNVDQKELDKFVIGSWVQYHRSEDIISREMAEKLNKAVAQREAQLQKA